MLVASAACALVIGWGLHLLGFVPFAALGPIIFLNDAVFGLLLAPPILSALAPRVRAWGLTYEEQLDEQERRPGALARPASVLAAAAAVGGLFLGIYLSVVVHGQPLLRALPEVGGAASVGLGLLPAVLLLLVASLML